MNYLASPPLVVAYALAGSMDVDLFDRPAGPGHRRQRRLPARHLAVAEPRSRRSSATRSPRRCSPTTTPTSSPATSAGSRCRRPRATPSSGTPTRRTCASRRTSTACPASRRRSSDIAGARVLAKLGDSVTTDHISPAGSIKTDTPAGTYLAEHGVEQRDFNSYGSRRGNHEVMIRGTFANIRLRNQLAPGTEGGFTRDFADASGEVTTIYDALSGLRRGGHAAGDPRRQGVRLGLVARLGRQGHRAARRQGRDRRVVRADPPVQPDRHGRAAAAVPGGRDRRVAGPDRRGDVRRSPGVTALNDGHDARARSRSRPDGDVEFDAVVRIDTPGEADYYRHGGIMQYVLRSLRNA